MNFTEYRIKNMDKTHIFRAFLFRKKRIFMMKYEHAISLDKPTLSIGGKSFKSFKSKKLINTLKL
jgi:hypothetical protein